VGFSREAMRLLLPLSLLGHNPWSRKY